MDCLFLKRTIQTKFPKSQIGFLSDFAQAVTTNLALKFNRFYEKPIACTSPSSFPTFCSGQSGYHFSIQPIDEKDAESSHHFSC
jgi:hypothetical protein